MRRRVPVETRFWGKVVRGGADACWLWTAATNYDYGVFGVEDQKGKRRMVAAHRVAWYLTYGAWPEYTIDHLCLNRGCVNPSHMEDVTTEENSRRIFRRGHAPNQLKRACPRGHPYDRIKTRGDGSAFRACSVCSLDSTHRSRNRKRKVAA